MKRIILITFFITSQALSANPIHFGYGDHNSPPYIVLNDKRQVIGGELLDIARFVSKELGLEFEMVNTPRNRLEDMILKGHIDLYCNSKSEWSSRPKSFYWFNDIIEDENLLFAKLGSYHDIKNLREIKVNLGAIKGFSYHPDIEKLIERVGRQDLRTHQTLFQFLERDRTELIISSKSILDNYYKGQTKKFHVVTNFRNKFTYDCIISKKIKFNKDKLLKALEKYKSRND